MGTEVPKGMGGYSRARVTAFTAWFNNPSVSGAPEAGQKREKRRKRPTRAEGQTRILDFKLKESPQISEEKKHNLDI